MLEEEYEKDRRRLPRHLQRQPEPERPFSFTIRPIGVYDGPVAVEWATPSVPRQAVVTVRVGEGDGTLWYTYTITRLNGASEVAQLSQSWTEEMARFRHEHLCTALRKGLTT